MITWSAHFLEYSPKSYDGGLGSAPRTPAVSAPVGRNSLRERTKLLILIAVFGGAYFLPIETPRVQGAFLEGLFLLKDYARQHVLLLGPPGTGKSHLVQAIGYQAIKMGHTALYRSIFDVVRDFLHDEALGGEEKVLARYLKPDLLIVDDMGMKQLP